MRIPKELTLYIRSMGKALRVTAIFQDVDEANKYMEQNKDEGVVAEFNGMVLLADLYDHGAEIG